VNPKDMVLYALNEHWRRYHVPPTIRDLQRATGISTTSLVAGYLQELEADGEIQLVGPHRRKKPVPKWVTQRLGGSK
jgi:hypothetical protein